MCAQSTSGGAECLVVRECVCTQARARAFQAEGPVFAFLTLACGLFVQKSKGGGVRGGAKTITHV